MEHDNPPWLKAMHNGALGEARAKAFLMDRFWILERSVDIDGADLIIQRRLTKRNLLDKHPPIFGFIQAKFLESEKTTHYLPKAYIIDNFGKLREDFFLLLHTGFGESARIFFLTPEIISNEFEIVEKAGTEQYRIGGKRILENKKFLVESHENTLKRIETGLALADIKRNREFISWKLPNIYSEPTAIFIDYSEPLENSWGHIPSEFQKIKEYALNAMKGIENLYFDLKSIAEEIDPMEAFNKIQSLKSAVGGNKYGYSNKELIENLYDENFYFACRTHKERVETLREDGLLDKFIKIKEIIKKSVVDFLLENLPIDSNTIHSIIIEFSLNDFEIKFFRHNLIKVAEYFNIPSTLDRFGYVSVSNDQYNGIKEISDNCFECFWLAGRLAVTRMSNTCLQEYYKENDFRIFNDCLDKMFELKYCS